MRLAAFITANTRTILREWVRFANQTHPEAHLSQNALLDHGDGLLAAIVREMSAGTESVRRGVLPATSVEGLKAAQHLLIISRYHTKERGTQGFNLVGILAEYAALRADVVASWRGSGPEVHHEDFDDLAAFHAAIDQLVSASAERYLSVAI